jgi:DNA-binding MarR family transcriptional regulator
MHSALRRSLLAAALVFSWTQPASADTYPNKPITLVVTQGPGSGSDIMARLLAGYLSPALGQSVVVENRAGASGILGHQSVSRAAPDGYTLLFTSTAGLFVVPVMNPNARYSLADYTPVAPVMRAPFAMLVAGLSLPEYRVMAVLESLGQQGVAGLQETMLIDKAWISRTLGKLVHKGLAVSAPDENDARRTLFSLTTKGRRAAHALIEQATERQELILRGVNAHDRKYLIELLSRIQENVDAMSQQHMERGDPTPEA